jgi:hypothetical protein
MGIEMPKKSYVEPQMMPTHLGKKVYILVISFFPKHPTTMRMDFQRTVIHTTYNSSNDTLAGLEPTLFRGEKTF